MPKRLQRKRTVGWKMGANGKCITRPGKWGNPFTAAEFGLERCLELYRNMVEGRWTPSLFAKDEGELLHRAYALFYSWEKNFRKVWGGNSHDALCELRGFDLYCFCEQGKPCHGDCLIKLANKD